VKLATLADGAHPVHGPTMRRAFWLLPLFLIGCRSESTTEPIATARATASAAPLARPSASAAGPVAKDQSYAKHSAAALVSECIERSWFGYLCNNAYAAAAERFPGEAETIQSLMRLAVRVGAGKPLGGEGEVVSACQVEKGEGAAYPCLYLADGDTTPRGKAAHALACKGSPPEGQVPVAGDKPIVIKPLPQAEADLVKRCFACGNIKEVSNRDLSKLASAKACRAVMKRVSEREAKFITSSIEPLCPKGS
jgi:hypothetical protein